MTNFDVTIYISTFGEKRWQRLAEQRAIPSAEALGVPVIYKHDETLAKARNAGLNEVDTEFAIALDADDELDGNYINEMAKGTADLRAPSRLDIVDGRPRWAPYVPQVWSHKHACTGECLRYGNWLTIGTCVRTERAQRAGWEEFGWSEDYAHFARQWKAGATVEALPTAIYRAFWSRKSRNRVANQTGVDWHRKIEAAVWPDEPSVL